MTPEGKVKRKIREWYKANLPGHYRISPRPGPFSVAGQPDDVLCWMGVFIGIEIKAAVTGYDTTPLQIANLKSIQAAGGVAAVVRGYDVAKLEAIKRAVLDKVRAKEQP